MRQFLSSPWLIHRHLVRLGGQQSGPAAPGLARSMLGTVRPQVVDGQWAVRCTRTASLPLRLWAVRAEMRPTCYPMNRRIQRQSMCGVSRRVPSDHRPGWWRAAGSGSRSTGRNILGTQSTGCPIGRGACRRTRFPVGHHRHLRKHECLESNEAGQLIVISRCHAELHDQLGGHGLDGLHGSS